MEMKYLAVLSDRIVVANWSRSWCQNVIFMNENKHPPDPRYSVACAAKCLPTCFGYQLIDFFLRARSR